jgi:nucleoid DNA-binding protein
MATTIENIVNKIKSALNSARPKAMNIPGIFMLCSLAKRPGLSVSVSTAITVSKLKVLGFPTGTRVRKREKSKRFFWIYG